MARKSKPAEGEPTNLSDAGTSSVANRKAAEKERQAQAREDRAALIKETKAAQKATAEFLASKPTDSRKIADTRNVGG